MEEVLDNAKREDEIKKKRLKEIAKSHMTEFIDDRYADFEQILGMSEMEKNDKNKQQNNVLDPHVVDAMKESVHFSKQVDGYPWYFEREPFSQFTLFGTHS